MKTGLKKYKTPSKGIRKQQVALLNQRYPHYTLKANCFASLFLVGLGAIIWEIQLFQRTFIDPAVPLLLAIVTGVALIPVLRRTVNIYLYNPYNIGKVPLPFHFLFNTVAFGGLLTFCLTWTNWHFAHPEKQVLTLPIESKGHLASSKGSCGQPYVMIEYRNVEKQLVFACGTAIEKYERVYIEVQRGSLGYDVVTRQTLVEGQW